MVLFHMKTFSVCITHINQQEPADVSYSWRRFYFAPVVSLACFRESPGALAAARAVPSDEAGGNATEAAGLGDGGPRGEPVGAV